CVHAGSWNRQAQISHGLHVSKATHETRSSDHCIRHYLLTAKWDRDPLQAPVMPLARSTSTTMLRDRIRIHLCVTVSTADEMCHTALTQTCVSRTTFRRPWGLGSFLSAIRPARSRDIRSSSNHGVCSY